MSICWFNHLWGKWEVFEVEATGTSAYRDTRQRRTCSRCGKTEWEYLR